MEAFLTVTWWLGTCVKMYKMYYVHSSIFVYKIPHLPESLVRPLDRVPPEPGSPGDDPDPVEGPEVLPPDLRRRHRAVGHLARVKVLPHVAVGAPLQLLCSVPERFFLNIFWGANATTIPANIASVNLVTGCSKGFFSLF